MSLLSLSPLLSSLFISCADRVVALEPTPATPSPEREERKTPRTTITTLQEENEKLKLETHEMMGKLEAAETLQETLSRTLRRSARQNDSLRAELAEAEARHDRLTVDFNAERAALQIRVSNLEVSLKPHLVRIVCTDTGRVDRDNGVN
jgi:septal ring factor EnvC (AmiA/AmiB activator)